MFPIADKQVTNISYLGVSTIPIFLNKSMVDLQYCFIFKCTAKWCRNTYTYNTIFLDSFPL